MEFTQLVHAAGIIGILGTVLYGLGDVMLLAPSIGPLKSERLTAFDLSAFPALQGREKIFLIMANLPWKRLKWGGLIALFAAPLTLGGYLLIFAGLSQAGFWQAFFPTLFFIIAVIMGPFVHGSFIYLGENIQGFLQAEGSTRVIFAERLARQQSVMAVGYGVILILNGLGTAWFAGVVAFGETAFPVWMAAVNPVTLTLAWIGLKKILPDSWLSFTDGAGFNIAYFIFFALMTFFLW